ncbi:MAG: radical SAM protein [Lachnospiraceae bacterium]|nr:radical SAM protein [Lachnospiraceae bacterium]
MYYRLKRFYKFGESQGCNFILSKHDEECVFLNRGSAVLLNLLLLVKNESDAIEEVSKVFGLSNKESLDKIKAFIDRINGYLDAFPDEKEHIELKDYSDFRIILSRSDDHIHPVEKDPYPRKIKFYLTDYCVRNCIYCFAGAKVIKNVKVSETFLSVERFEEIIKEAQNIGVENIEIAGGDPFVLENAEDYIEVALRHFKGDIGISTKTLITKERAEKLKNIGLAEMQVSIDSVDRSIADKMMGVKGSYDDVMQTIRNLMNAGIEPTVKAVITSLNIEGIPEYFETMFNMGIRYIRTSYYYRSANRHSDVLFPSNEQINELNTKMKSVLERLIPLGLKTDFYYEKAKEASKKDERIFCGGFTSSMSVRYDGEVLFCDSLNHSDDFISGNLKNKGIMEVWNSKEAKNMGDPSYFYEKFKGTECYECKLYHNCFYKRCFVRTYNQYGTFFEKDPACPYGIKGYIL